MKMNQLVKLIKSGKNPEVKMKDSIEKYACDSLERNMSGKILSMQLVDGNFKVVIDLNGHETENRAVGSLSWYDEEDDSLSTWVDTEYYPSDGFITLEIPTEDDSPFILKD